jgi:hypothetical protein
LGNIKAFLELKNNKNFRVEALVSGYVFTFSNVPAGNYDVQVWVENYGYATFG